MSDRFVILETEEALLEGEFHNGNIFLHVKYNESIKFTKTIYKKFLSLWNRVREALKAQGVYEVFSFVSTESEKINKWQEMFGLTPLLETKSHILYRRFL